MKNKDYVVLLSWFMTHNDQYANFQIVNSLGIPQGLSYSQIVHPSSYYEKDTYLCTLRQAKQIAHRIRDSINHPTILSLKNFTRIFSHYYPKDINMNYNSSIAENEYPSDTNPKHFWHNWNK